MVLQNIFQQKIKKHGWRIFQNSTEEIKQLNLHNNHTSLENSAIKASQNNRRELFPELSFNFCKEGCFFYQHRNTLDATISWWYSRNEEN